MALFYDEYRASPDESVYNVVKVPREVIPSLWKTVEPWIEIGLGVAPELTMEEVIEGLYDQSVQLWIVCRILDGSSSMTAGAFLTSVENDRGDWVISLYALGGQEPKKWLDICNAKMQLFAMQEGAKRVRMCGRKAWSRLLPESFAVTGMRFDHYVYERDV